MNNEYPLEFSVASVSATIKNFQTAYVDFQSEPPVYFGTSKPEKEKKSTRGRKKKTNKIKKKFKSNQSFLISLNKVYDIRVFNGGNIVCVGVLDQNKSDFYQCVNELKKYLVRSKLRTFEHLNLPEPIFTCLREQIESDFEILDVHSTLEIYKFNIGRFINLYSLKEYLIEHSKSEIINVDFQSLYTFITNNILGKIFMLDTETIMRNITKKNKVIINLVDKNKLHHALENADLFQIFDDFHEFWNSFIERHEMFASVSFLESMKFNFLKQYVIYSLKHILDECTTFEDNLFESVIYKENKNTLTLRKNISGKIINYRIFGTGIVDLQGCKNKDIAEQAKKIIIPSLIKYTYDQKLPPIITWREALKPLGVNKHTNTDVNYGHNKSTDK